MSDDKTGVRALPPALLLGFILWFASMLVRIIYMFSVKEPWSGVRFHLASEGIGFAAEALAMFGAFELARRLSGQLALGIKIAAFGLLGALVVNSSYSLLEFKDNLWEHEWVFKLYDYVFFAVWFVVPIGLAIANWRERRELAIFVIVLSLLTWPPPFLAKAMYSWLPSGKTGYVIDGALRSLRFGFLLVAFAKVAGGSTLTDRVLASSGLRTSAKALWLRVIAAVVVVCLTLMVIAGKGTPGRVEVLKLAMFTALIVNMFALWQFGAGAVRTSRGNIAELGRWSFAISGGVSLWGAGVMLAQMSWLYKMLYKSDSSSFSSQSATEYAQALSIAMPVLITIGIGLLAVAISGFAARRGSEDLRAHAQAKGAGFVTLTLVSVAIQSWMLPKAASMGSFAMLSLLAAGSSLVAIVMMARLLNLAADELDSEPGLPAASVISDGT